MTTTMLKMLYKIVRTSSKLKRDIIQLYNSIFYENLKTYFIAYCISWFDILFTVLQVKNYSTTCIVLFFIVYICETTLVRRLQKKGIYQIILFSILITLDKTTLTLLQYAILLDHLNIYLEIPLLSKQCLYDS